MAEKQQKKTASELLKRAELVNRVLYSIAGAINTTMALDDLYQAIHHSLGNIIDVSNFYIAIVDQKEKTIYFPYFVDTVDEDWAPTKDFDIGNSLTGHVVLQRKPIMFEQDELQKLSRKNSILGTMPLIWLGVPLIVRDEVIGVIAIQSYTDPFLFSEKDLQLLAAISDQIAMAIDRQRSTDDLLKSEKKYRNLFHNAQVGLFRTDEAKGKVIECNHALARMFGYEDRREFIRHFSPESAYVVSGERERLIDRLVSQGKVTNLEVSMRKKNCNLGWFRFSADYYPEHNLVEGVVIDITEMKTANEEKLELQRKLEQSRKMEALGLLAGGVAHDLNNILSGIVSYPELIMHKFSDNKELQKPLKAIMESGRRAAAIVGDMLALARSAASVREPHNLHRLIYDYLDSPECGQFKLMYPDIAIRTESKAASATILCSPVHIKKCIMNLVTNGVEAIADSGTIILSTTNLVTTVDQKDSPQDSSEKEFVVLSVEDNGTGISDDDMEHIFEPFYTRKGQGRSGTGLGLTVVWNTMQDHGGKVTISSTKTGTCFKLFFPVDTSGQPGLVDESSPNVVVGKGESILVVDDEPQLRDIACQVLTAAGYSVHAVASGEMALEYLGGKSVDLVLLDMLMEPGMNGCQTYEEIIKTHPGQKAIIVSGFSESDDVTAALNLGVGSYIKKPYTMDQLSGVVSTELGKS